MFRRWGKILLPVLYLLSPISAIVLYFRGAWYTFFDPWSIAITLGLVGYFYLAGQFITSARLRWLDKMYGNDGVLRFHSITAIFGFGAVIAHRMIRHRLLGGEVNWQIRFGIIGFVIFAAVVVVTLVLMVPHPFGAIGPIRQIRRWMERRGVRYVHYRRLHNITAIAISFGLLHVLRASSTQFNPLHGVVIAAWYAIAMGCYLYHKVVRPFLEWRRMVPIVEVERPTQNRIVLRMAAPPHWRTHSAGQYMWIRFPNRARFFSEDHPFTISSAPESGILEITAKQAGHWTDGLSKVEAGEKAALCGPYGKFCYTEAPPHAHLCLIGGGIGITPYLSMLAELERSPSERRNYGKIWLFWGVRTARDYFWLERLRSLEARDPQFSLILTVSQDEQWTGLHGRITADMLAANISPDEWGSTDFFVCGPSGMTLELRKKLRARGVSARHFHSESFHG